MASKDWNCLIHLKSLGIEKSASADVVGTKEGHLVQLIYAIYWLILIVLFPKYVMCYPRIHVTNQSKPHN